jgi:hypothetical protein
MNFTVYPYFYIIFYRGNHGSDRMVVGFTITYANNAKDVYTSLTVPITTNVVSSHPAHGEVYSIQHYVIKFVSDLLQVDSILRVLRFPPPIKQTSRI